METAHFLAWLILFTTVAGVGIAIMLWAYIGAGSVNALFQEPVSLAEPEPLEPAIIGLEVFQTACTAFQSGNYRKAVSLFEQVVRQNPDVAEAHHNRGLALANIKKVQESVASLMRAGELYARQDNPDQLTLLKAHLSTMKQGTLKQGTR